MKAKVQIDSDTERREYFRIELPFALRTQMTILSFNHKKLSIGSTEILVMDIGPGGLRFTSHLRLTTQENIIYGFETNIMETPLSISGKIVWEQEVYQGIFQYLSYQLNLNNKQQSRF